MTVALLKDSQRRMTSVQWPTEVDDRLDVLVRLAAGEGVPISRAQMLSALVANASVNSAAIARVARRYLGGMQAGDLARTAPPPETLPEVRHRGRQRTDPA